MTSRDLCFWLQGMFELTETKQLDEKQTEMLKKHLALVFKHEIAPSVNEPAKPVATLIPSVWPAQGATAGGVSLCGDDLVMHC